MHKESKIFNKGNIILLTSAVYFLSHMRQKKMSLALIELKCINL